MICGNHDPESKNSFYSSYPWCKNVYILGRKNPYMVFDKEKVCVYGIGMIQEEDSIRLSENIRTDRNYTNILLMHGDVDRIYLHTIL